MTDYVVACQQCSAVVHVPRVAELEAGREVEQAMLRGAADRIQALEAAGAAVATALADEHYPSVEDGCWKCEALLAWHAAGGRIYSVNDGSVWTDDGWAPVEETQP